MTTDELRKADEANLHGAIQAAYSANPNIPISRVVDLIERRFGVAPDTTDLLTTREANEMLARELTSAMEHLRPDTVDWFKQRMNYVLQCAAARARAQ